MNKVVAALVLCRLLFFGAAQDSQIASQAVIAAIRAKDFKRAVDTAQQALRAAPNDAQLFTLQGIALQEMGQPTEALGAFRQALNIAPDSLAALEGAAQLEYAARNEAAVPLLDRLLTLLPQQDTAHAMRAVMAWNQGDCKTAVIHFEASRAAIASQPDALRQYGVCLVRLGKTETAEKVFNQIVSSYPADRAARFALASVNMILRHYAAALDALRPLTTAQADSHALALTSTAYEALGDTPKAAASLRQAIAIDALCIDCYVDFASLSFIHQSFQAGIELLNAGLRVSPQSPQLHLARGILYVQIGDTDRADADFSASQRLNPDQVGTGVARALTALQYGSEEEALRIVRKEIASNRNDAFLYYLLGEILTRQGLTPGAPEFNDAVEALRKAVQLQPTLTLARNVLSKLYLDVGQIDLAIEQCNLVLKDSPHDIVGTYRLIGALKARGNPEDAGKLRALTLQFSEAREVARQQEARENQYRLIIDSASSK